MQGMIFANSSYYYDMEFDGISISLKENLTILTEHQVIFEITYKYVAKKYKIRVINIKKQKLGKI